jgi:hypothetical protein
MTRVTILNFTAEVDLAATSRHCEIISTMKILGEAYAVNFFRAVLRITGFVYAVQRPKF